MLHHIVSMCAGAVWMQQDAADWSVSVPVLCECSKTLQIAMELGDRALEAQACYSLGNTYTVMRDYERAIEYHVRHLRIAQVRDHAVAQFCGRIAQSRTAAHACLCAIAYMLMSLSTVSTTRRCIAQETFCEFVRVINETYYYYYIIIIIICLEHG